MVLTHDDVISLGVIRKNIDLLIYSCFKDSADGELELESFNLLKNSMVEVQRIFSRLSSGGPIE